MPALGVGVVYWPEFESLVREDEGLVSVVEIEPQPFWTPLHDGTYRQRRETTEHLAALPAAKIIHSVGMPVGGSRPPDEGQLGMLATTVRKMNAPWVSEHLAFVHAGHDAERFSGFMLPPLQTPAGVTAAAHTVRLAGAGLPVPLAVENGVNYLRPRPGDLSDGEFFGGVVRAAGCGIVLDLHNAYTNARNGRQSLDGFLDEIPLERVWEVHVAGGCERNGYWLDAHSGLVPPDLDERLADILLRLPNLRALIFEMNPAFVKHVPLAAVAQQLRDLHALWDATASARDVRCLVRRPAPPRDRPRSYGAAERWEDALSALVAGAEPCDALSASLAGDGSIALWRDLVSASRCGAIASALPFTTRLIVLSSGTEPFRRVFAEYAQQYPTRMFALEEGRQFASFLRAQTSAPTLLDDLLAYECAAMDAAASGEAVRLTLAHDIRPALEDLRCGRPPRAPQRGPITYSVDA